MGAEAGHIRGGSTLPVGAGMTGQLVSIVAVAQYIFAARKVQDHEATLESCYLPEGIQTAVLLPRQAVCAGLGHPDAVHGIETGVRQGFYRRMPGKARRGHVEAGQKVRDGSKITAGPAAVQPVQDNVLFF